MKLNKGFTLIELLVVIAIIGILSSVVLASLNTARDKGADAAIKSNLNGIRAQAELVYDRDSKYDNVCEDDNIEAAIAAAKNANGNASVECRDGSQDGTADSWAVMAVLKSSNTLKYCIDYKGNATTSTTVTLPTTAVEAKCQ